MMYNPGTAHGAEAILPAYPLHSSLNCCTLFSHAGSFQERR
jgi:hypothetical protein